MSVPSFNFKTINRLDGRIFGDPTSVGRIIMRFPEIRTYFYLSRKRLAPAHLAGARGSQFVATCEMAQFGGDVWGVGIMQF